MSKDIRAIIEEDDPYSRDLMTMLLTRDWRTRVAGEFGSDAESELSTFLKEPTAHVDVVIVDTEVPGDEHWPNRVASIALQRRHPPIMLYTCTRPNTSLLGHLPKQRFGGYLVKSEVLYSLAYAVAIAASGKTVITPGIQDMIGALDLPDQPEVINGTVPVASFTPRESDLVRLGLLFNLAQRDIADELVVSVDFVSEVMGNIYEKLGLHEIMSGESPLEVFFEDPDLLARCRAVLDRAKAESGGKALRKAPWLSTIAFHLLTAPERGTQEE